MNQLTYLKRIRIRPLLIALAIIVISPLVSIPVLATPSAGVATEFIVGNAAAGSPVGELDIFAKWDIDPSIATHFWMLRIDSKGATDLYIVRNTFQPGGTTGWHTHPGPSLVSVTAGAITAYDGNCVPRVYGPGQAAGSSFIDIGGGDVHLLRNESNLPAVTVAVQFIPSGFPRRIDADNPGCAGIN